jgi:hypothetical protein
MAIEYRVAHEHPEQPLGPGVRLCNCKACLFALQASVRRNPRSTLLIRTSFDRIVVTADYLAEVWEGDGWIDGLLYQPGDWIRDVGSATQHLPAPARWWSRCLSEQVGVQQAFRMHVAKHRPLPRLHRVA